MCHNTCTHTLIGWMRVSLVERVLKRHSRCWYPGIVCGHGVTMPTVGPKGH